MNKTIFLLSLLILSSVVFAQTADGLTCETAIPVGSDFQTKIDAPGEYYFSAWTYDLPLTCYFYPTTGDVSTLYLDIDFTCTPGVYDDHRIKELLDATSGWGVSLPIRFDDFERAVDEHDRVYYSLSVSDVYRELMVACGISYDVQALVKVTTSSAGEVRMTPDTTFRSCVESAIWLNLPATVNTGSQHSGDLYLLPLSDWQNDSIQLTWTGTQAPVQIWMGSDCEFELKTYGENCAIDMVQLSPDAGNGENVWTITKEMVGTLISLLDQGGMCYLYFVSTEDAQVIFERKAIEGPLATAIRMELNEAAPVKANDAEQLYYFPAKWKSNSLIFSSSSSQPVTAYFAKDYAFEADAADENVVAVYDFVLEDGVMQLGFSSAELEAIAKQIDGEFVMAKFISELPTTITPARWDLNECLNKSVEIRTTDSVPVASKASGAIYRIDYQKWSACDVKLQWNSKSRVKFYIADACSGYTLSSTNEHVLLYQQLNAGDSLQITSAAMEEWADRVDEDGYLYIRMDANTVGDLIVSSVVVKDPNTPDEDQETAIPLVLEVPVTLTANTLSEVHYFTTDWAEQSIEFVDNTADTVIAYFATTAEVEQNYFAAYPFAVGETQSRLQLSALQLSTMLQSASKGKIYVAFKADHDAEVTPKIWSACACASNSFDFAVSGEENIAARSHDVVYRVNYNYWKDYDVTLHWSGNTIIWAYLATVCDFYLVETNMYVLNKSDVDILPNDTMQIGEEVRLKAIDGGMLPEDGFLYFRFSTASAGVLTPTFYPVNPDTAVEDVVADKRRNKIICTPDGQIYILVGEERYTILGEKL